MRSFSFANISLELWIHDKSYNKLNLLVCLVFLSQVRMESVIAVFGDAKAGAWFVACYGACICTSETGFTKGEVNVYWLSGRTSLEEPSPYVYLFTFPGSSNRPCAFFTRSIGQDIVCCTGSVYLSFRQANPTRRVDSKVFTSCRQAKPPITWGKLTSVHSYSIPLSD